MRGRCKLRIIYAAASPLGSSSSGVMMPKRPRSLAAMTTCNTVYQPLGLKTPARRSHQKTLTYLQDQRFTRRPEILTYDLPVQGANSTFPKWKSKQAIPTADERTFLNWTPTNMFAAHSLSVGLQQARPIHQACLHPVDVNISEHRRGENARTGAWKMPSKTFSIGFSIVFISSWIAREPKGSKP